MQLQNGILARRLLAVAAGVLLAASPAAFASGSPTANGTLTVTATVTSSLQLTFSTATNGPTVTNSYNASTNTSTATLPFGNIVAYGAEPTGVSLVSSSTSLAVCGTCFEVSAPVNIAVTQADGSSSNYTLTAELGSNDTQNYWAAGTASATQLTNTATTNITSTGTYGSSMPVTIYLGVPNTTVTTSSISNTVNFVATAN